MKLENYKRVYATLLRAPVQRLDESDSRFITRYKEWYRDRSELIADIVVAAGAS